MASHKSKAKVKSNSSKSIEGNLRLHKSLKSSSYDEALKSLREQLPKHKSRFSKVSHGKGMDELSDFLAMTLARPRSILCGSLLALIVVLKGVYLSSHYGYSYNYLLLVLFYLIGYFLELIIELIIGIFVKRT
jgi:hypothetical protein